MVMSESMLQPFHIGARNLPEHRTNPIHTDEGAVAQGFPGALVAGVTTYAYLTHVPAAAWGLSWIRGGSSEVSFQSPVMANAALTCVPRSEGAQFFVDAITESTVRATCQVWPEALDAARLRDGERLEPVEQTLDEAWARYGQRCGDPLEVYDDEGITHPAAWPNLANHITHAQVVEGSWIHTRSRISHLGRAPFGDQVLIEASVVNRFDTRSGERAILDVVITGSAGPVAYLEHEALVRLSR